VAPTERQERHILLKRLSYLVGKLILEPWYRDDNAIVHFFVVVTFHPSRAIVSRLMCTYISHMLAFSCCTQFQLYIIVGYDYICSLFFA
jgi:hypothetical protein